MLCPFTCLLPLCYHSPSTDAHTPAMASSALSSSLALVLILLLAVTLVHGATEQRLSLTATVIECYPAPAPTNATSNGSAFGANVLSLLAALPNATAPTGFASLHSGGSSSSSRAFVRGLCFGDATPLVECRRCLSAAATDLASGCPANSTPRAGIWSDGCFVSYADTNANTSSEAAFRARVISGPADNASDAGDLQRLAAVAQYLAPYAAASDGLLAVTDATDVTTWYAATSTVRVLAQCARDLPTAADCARCIDYSARVAETCCWGLDPWRDGVAAAVVGFNCYLRYEVSTAAVPLRDRLVMLVNNYPFFTAVLALLVVALVALLVGALVGLIRKICTCWMERNAAAAAPWAPVAVHVNPAQA